MIGIFLSSERLSCTCVRRGILFSDCIVWSNVPISLSLEVNLATYVMFIDSYSFMDVDLM